MLSELQWVTKVVGRPPFNRACAKSRNNGTPEHPGRCRSSCVKSALLCFRWPVSPLSVCSRCGALFSTWTVVGLLSCRLQLQSAVVTSILSDLSVFCFRCEIIRAFAKRKTERSSKIEVIRADYNANDKNVNHFVLEIEHTDNEVISQRKIKMAGLTHEESEIHTYWVLIFLYFLTIFLSNIIFIFYFFEILWCVNIFRCSGVAECSSLFRSTWFQHITSNKKSTTLHSTK